MADWKTLSEQVLLSRKPYFEVIQQEVETDRGVVVPDFYQVRFGVFVIVVPVLSDGRVLTLRSYKHGAGRVSMTFPAGFLDPGEGPEQAMRRELMEETGYSAGEVIPLGRFIDNGNQIGSEGHYFLALDCTQVQQPDDGDLEVMKPELHSAHAVEDAIFADDMPILHHPAAWFLALTWARRNGRTLFADT